MRAPPIRMYFDHCASTPLLADVRGRLVEAYAEYGNPAVTSHGPGSTAGELLDRARHQVALALGLPFGEVIFTSGATEANVSVLRGFVETHGGRCRIIQSAIEHSSIRELCAHYRDLGIEIATIPVTRTGQLEFEQLEKELANSSLPTLVAVMHTNNEIPVLLGNAAVGGLCARYGAHFHCDAVQGAARSKIDFAELRCHTATVSPHKMYGPKGVGILISRDSDHFTPLFPGSQEFGRRAGTPNLPGIILTGWVMELFMGQLPKLSAHLVRCQRRFVETLRLNLEDWELSVPTDEIHCPGIVNFWIYDLGATLLLENVPEIAIGRGSACRSAGGSPSFVGEALGLSRDVAANLLRASFGWGCSADDAAEAARRISEVAAKLRGAEHRPADQDGSTEVGRSR